MINRILERLNKGSYSSGLGIFRILFGLIMIWEVLYFYRVKLLENFIFLPATLFNYDFLPVSPLAEPAMQIILSGMLISSVLITVGLFFRLASFYLFISLSYIFLLDKGLYNNHIFLICLIALFLTFTNADAAFSLSKSKHSIKVPYWQYLVLQIHIAMVYFFGGISKINPYWLNRHPVKELLINRAKYSGYDFISSEFIEFFIMSGGLAFDLCIPFLLWYKRTRVLALIFALIFNLINAWLFRDINIFPYFMAVALILFVDPAKISVFVKKLNIPIPSHEKILKQVGKPGLLILIIYFSIHFFLPLRHFLLPGYVDWTGEGQRFAWRMKIQYREIDEMTFAVFDLDKKEIHEIDPKELINLSQYQQMANHPKMVLQFAEYLKKLAYKTQRIKNCMIKCKVKVKFNGSESLYIFNPEIDILEAIKNDIPINQFINAAPPPGNY